jgi:hypothetical protein
MSKARRARLRALLEEVKPTVTIRVRLKDMSPVASGAPVVPRQDSPTPVGAPECTLAAGRPVAVAKASAPTGTRLARCPRCRAKFETPAGEAGAVCRPTHAGW